MTDRKKIRYTLLLLAAVAVGMLAPAARVPGLRKAQREERRADRHFIAQRFGRAMVLYDEAIADAPVPAVKAELHLKAARLHFMLRDYPQAAAHFARTMELDETILAVADVCDYIDALRFAGRTGEAEAVCLEYAYRDRYSRNQRYGNLLDALAMRHEAETESGYEVRRMLFDSPFAEYWVGRFRDQLFYAMSRSAFNDPHKLFFHRTHYYTFNPRVETAEPLPTQGRRGHGRQFFPSIPLALMDGPVAVAADASLMIATTVVYTDKEQIRMVDGRLKPFATHLLVSEYDARRNGWTAYKPAFPQADSVSYAHPFLCDDDRTLLFASDMPGGYGGFDLYVSRWDEQEHRWSEPVNLGPAVNTEGDEIYPVATGNGRLVFASNGLPGFGGYDLFVAGFDAEGIVPGSVTHFPWPVNSQYNDYYLLPTDPQSGFFASDRDRRTGDDIYAYRFDRSQLTDGAPFFGLSEAKAVTGGALALDGLVEQRNSEPWRVPLPEYVRPSRELLAVVYFDFDDDKLDADSRRTLDGLTNGLPYLPDGFDLVGYADEIGGESYNDELSSRRAKAVAAYLEARMGLPCTAEGRGKVRLTRREMEQALRWIDRDDASILGREERIRLNRRARRVEIYNRTANQ
ncbi:MAG: OmpA family protein [Rikenellaceae bacterium]|nr:OmpA family protein [Rikenellaceae bacterium]